MRRLALAASALLALVAAAAPLRAEGVDVYGKPLRGLSPVPIAQVIAEPQRYAGKPIRVEGSARVADGRLILKDGEATLAVVADGFALPEKTEGRVAAEGRVFTEGEKAPLLRASGIEIRR